MQARTVNCIVLLPMAIPSVRVARFLLAACLGVSAGIAAAPGEAAGKWTQLQSENFLFIGDASEGQIRRVAERLEQFRDVLLTVLPRASAQSAVPTIVMVFDEERSISPVAPLFRGRPVEVAGYFLAGADVNYITVNAEDLERAVPTIFHEYAHFLINENQGRVPVWVNEGLAELYATFERMDDDGRRVIIGRAPGHHLTLLKSSTLMTVKQLVAVDEKAAVYNEGSRRGVLYAQSWALVHYLNLGNPARAGQFRSYLSAMESGTAHEQAFAAAFGADVAALDSELAAYVRQFTFPAVRFEFPEKSAATSIPRGEVLEDDEAETYLADIQARIDRAEEARTRLAAIQKRNPKSGRALMVLGAIHMREKRVSDAVAHLEKAAALAPDDFMVQSAYGRSLAMQMSEAPASAPKLLPQARQALERATTINPRSAPSAYLLGYAELAGGGEVAAAVKALERALQLDPRLEDARLLLPQALVRQGEYEKATALLGPLIASGRTTEVRENARRVLGDLANRRAALAAGAAAPPVTSPPLDADRLEEARRDGTRSSSLLLRVVQAGEQRVLGTLDAIDCARGAVVLRVTSNGRALALRATQLANVDFISYRSTAPGAVTCGQKFRDRIYATYRPDAANSGIDGLAVAIELLPDNFVEPKPQR
jgi:tetratricopeptide (TPR) repeat protein